MTKTSTLTETEFEHYQSMLCEIITRYLPACKVYLYGSRSRNDARPGSDIDIALDIGKKIEPLTMALLKGDIDESTIPFFVDIVDMHDVSEKFKEAVKKDMVPWKI